MAQVKCEDCAEYTDFRCTVYYRYTNPQLRRYCKRYKPRGTLPLAL